MELADLLAVLADDPDTPLDLAEVALRLAADEYPELDIADYLGRIDGLAEAVRPRLKGTLRQRVQHLGTFLFEEQGFRGCTQSYYDPRNSYFNAVLDRRAGIPISLSVLAIAVGARAGLEVVGVGLPGHFVAKAVAVKGPGVLFDPFHCGRLLTPRDCEKLVREVTGLSFAATPDQLTEAPPGRVVHRMLTNLKGIYLRQSDHERAVRVIERLRQLDPRDVSQQRDLGLALTQAGRPGRAVDHLKAYLKAVPEASDAEAVQQLLQRARGELARWN